MEHRSYLFIWVILWCSIRCEFLGSSFFDRYSMIQREMFSRTPTPSHCLHRHLHLEIWKSIQQRLLLKKINKKWVGKLLKIKFHWEPKLLLGVNKFLPKSWNSLSLSHEEFPSSFCHTCCTSDWLPLCIFFFQFKLKLVSEWVSKGVSSHFQSRYWTLRKVWGVLICK